MKRKALALLALRPWSTPRCRRRPRRPSADMRSRAPAAASSTRSSRVDPGARLGLRLQRHYASVGSGTGIADISAAHGRLRRVRRPDDDPTQAAACRRLRRDPVGAHRDDARPTTSPALPTTCTSTARRSLGIFLGTITNWNDPQIAALNPRLTLPNLAITPVHRSDGSGDTYAFTDYLSARQPRRSEPKVGIRDVVELARPASAASGNAGVAGVDREHARGDRLHQRRVHDPEPPQGGGDQERGRRTSPLRASRTSRRRPRRSPR